MDHVAIMNKSWKLIPKILTGEKSIESRWYQTKRTPWNMAKVGDKIFFKNAGEPVIARADISEVMQYEVGDVQQAAALVEKYGQEICLVNSDPKTWERLPNYCILLRLKNPQKIDTPFQINKKGFGGPVAWITVDDIKSIMVDTVQ